MDHSPALSPKDVLQQKLINPIKHAIRRYYYRLRFWGPIHIGAQSKIAPKAILETDGGSITTGRNTRIANHAMLLSCGGKIEIGDNCTVNPFCVLYGQGNLRIGNDVRIAAHTVIIPANHSFDSLATPIWRQAESKKGVQIGNDVWLGAGCRILDGVTIGDGCVVGAGAVVTKSLPAYSIAVGIPAKVIGNRQDRAQA